MGDLEDAVHLRDRLREAHDQLGAIRLVSDCACSLPDAQRLCERPGLGGLAREEHSLRRHEHVVEDHDRLGDRVPTAHGVVAVVFRPRCGRRRDEPHSWAVHGHRARDRGIVATSGPTARAAARARPGAPTTCCLPPAMTMPSVRRSTICTGLRGVVDRGRDPPVTVTALGREALEPRAVGGAAPQRADRPRSQGPCSRRSSLRCDRWTPGRASARAARPATGGRGTSDAPRRPARRSCSRSSRRTFAAADASLTSSLACRRARSPGRRRVTRGSRCPRSSRRLPVCRR